MINFKKYLSEKKIITAYHGSNVPIDKFNSKFSAQGVFWFSDNKKEITSGKSGAASTKWIMTVKLKVNKTAGWDEYDKLGLGQIEDMGYDSIKLYDDWIIFNAKNIKVVSKDQRK